MLPLNTMAINFQTTGTYAGTTETGQIAVVTSGIEDPIRNDDCRCYPIISAGQVGHYSINNGVARTGSCIIAQDRSTAMYIYTKLNAPITSKRVYR